MDEEEADYILGKLDDYDDRVTDHYDSEELDIEAQIDKLEEFIQDSDPRVLIENIALGAGLSGLISSVPISDDGVGIPPRMCEYLLGKIASAKEYGDEKPKYGEIADKATAVQDAYCYSVLSEIDPYETPDEEKSRKSIKFNLRLREVTAGRFWFWEQPIEVARRAYSPHSDMMVEAVGFNIGQAIKFTRYIEKKFDDLAVKVYFDESNIDMGQISHEKNTMESVVEQINEEGSFPKTTERKDYQRDIKVLEESYEKVSSYSDDLWISEQELLNQLPDDLDQEAFENYLKDSLWISQTLSLNFGI
ncbi:hypothetical protein ACFQL4_18925 [Halosimplex aquaticum]